MIQKAIACNTHFICFLHRKIHRCLTSNKPLLASEVRMQPVHTGRIPWQSNVSALDSCHTIPMTSAPMHLTHTTYYAKEIDPCFLSDVLLGFSIKGRRDLRFCCQAWTA